MTERAARQLIKVKAHARSRRRELRRNDDGSFEIWTTAAPERDRANEDIAEQLADHLSVSKSSVTLVSGRTSGRKVFEIAA